MAEVVLTADTLQHADCAAQATRRPEGICLVDPVDGYAHDPIQRREAIIDLAVKEERALARGVRPPT